MHRSRIVAAVAVGVLAVPAAARAAEVEIRTLSNRADLISGSDAAVGIRLPERKVLGSASISLNGRDVKSAFATTARGTVEGVVDGLRAGANTMEVRLRDGRGARLTITNHPSGGPIFAGPQVQPWICTTEDNGLGPPRDAQCNAPTQVSWLYHPLDAEPGAYEPYDPANPPSDVATTRTDEGRDVPFIVRVELGTVDRSIYRTAVLADPAKPWTRTAPQQAWNGKVFVPFGGGCGTPHQQKPPLDSEEQSVVKHELISRGWMGTASGLLAFSQNCNDVVAAEALMMQKEHIEERFGPIRHTVGMGGSGGSLLQHHIAAAYPGLLDGITVNSSFPDAWHTFTDVSDCHLLNHYFGTRSPHLWPAPDQTAAVMGKASPANCLMWTALFADAADPANRGATGIVPGVAPVRPGCGLPPGQAYHPVLNPTGVRCSAQDYQAAIWGRRGPRNAAPLPLDNEGVQYGLRQLEQGVITPAQFVDLNSKIGGLNNDAEFAPQRMLMDAFTATTMYRAARHADPRQLAKTAILDIRNNADDRDIHQPYMSRVVRARLDAVNGGHGNQVIWDHPGEGAVFEKAVLAVDRWLTAVEKDGSDRPIEQKIIRSRPGDLVDTCWIDDQPTTDAAACRAAYPYSGDARMSAGAPLRSDIRKCRLVPLRRDSYPATFTDTEWDALNAAFSTGVCDWSRPSVGYQPGIPWMTYAGGPGGMPLGAPPRSSEIGSRAPANRRAARMCPLRRHVTYRLPRRVTGRVRVTVGGKRQRVVRRGRRLVVTLRGLPRRKVKVVIRAEGYTRRAVLDGCSRTRGR